MHTTSAKKDLWLRLQAYDFEHIVPPHLSDRVFEIFGSTGASTHAFAAKLSRKLGWKMPFALRAIAEYKRFVFLGNSGGSVTPSKVIDQVWHEHLLFTRAYRDFCRDVIRGEFDHNPELLQTSAQTSTFEAQFDETLERYRREFNASPPADIWGTPKFKRDKNDATPSTSDVYTSSGTPLYMEMGSTSLDSSSHHSFFGEGGGFGGGGSDRSWGGSDHSTSHDAGSSGDGGHSCSSGSCSSGSGCSSSCGGGGCSS